MKREIHITPYDSADYLTSEEDIENFLQAMRKEAAAYPDHGAELMLLASGAAARARSRMELSKKSGLSQSADN